MSMTCGYVELCKFVNWTDADGALFVGVVKYCQSQYVCATATWPGVNSKKINVVPRIATYDFNDLDHRL